MARKITVTTAELDALRWVAERTGIYDETKEGAARMKALGKLLQKAEKAHAPPAKEAEHASFGELERVLLDNAGNKVVKLARLTAREYTIIAREIAERGVTEEQMRTLAQWLRGQSWMGTWKPTLRDVLKHWGAWYARAVAEGPVRGKPRGGPVLLDGDDGEEPSEE